MKTTYFPNLTPLRGIAALLTVIFHVDLMIGGGGNFLIKHKDSLVLTRMYLMVDFFFILSGFIMMHVYGKWFSEKINWNSFKKFTIARFARVYPLHFITLFYLVLLQIFLRYMIGHGPTDPMAMICNDFKTIPQNLLLIHSMNTTQWFTWNNASWSISTEWWAYMVFPFLVIPFLKLKKNGLFMVAFLCLIGYLGITYLIVPIVTVPASIPFTKVDPAALSLDVSYQFGFVRCICGFVLGIVSYQVYKLDWAKRLLANGYALLILFLSVMICMHFAIPDYYTVLLFPLILLSAAYGSQSIDKVFGTGPFQKLGDWSFSIYLIHQPIMYTLFAYMAYQSEGKAALALTPSSSVGMGWIICITFIAITLFISALSYRFIEVPARKWINSSYKEVR